MKNRLIMMKLKLKWQNSQQNIKKYLTIQKNYKCLESHIIHVFFGISLKSLLQPNNWTNLYTLLRSITNYITISCDK